MNKFALWLISGVVVLALMSACDTSTDTELPGSSNIGNTLTSETTVDTFDTSSGTRVADSRDSISAAEIDGILFMREEEKLARDTYLTLFDIWQDPVFSSIATSEQSHMDAMLRLINAYGLEDPASADIGVFFNTELQALYDMLTVRGMQSNIEALMVGAFIEEVDMRDIQQAIDEAQQADIISTYESLLCGSRNHLRSFVGRIDQMGVIYQAQELPQEEVDAIVNSPTERNCGR